MGKIADPKGNAPGGISVSKLAPVIILALILIVFFLFDLDDYFTFQWLSDNRDTLLEFVDKNYFLAAILFMGLYVIVVACSFPGGLLMTVTGGFLFGWIAAGFMAVFAATVGATILFMIAATSLGQPLRRRAGPWLKKLESGFEENALSYLLFLRLVPVFPFWIINIAPAFLGVGLGTYIIGTAIGIIPGTFVFAYLGVGLDSIIVEQQEKYQACLATGNSDCRLDFHISSLITKEIFFAFIALGVISLLPIVIKKFQKKKST